jgi:hypothetical protein
MRVKWNFDCGYVMRIPDFNVNVPDEDLEGLSVEEQEKVIEEYVKGEFDNRITYWWKREEGK